MMTFLTIFLPCGVREGCPTGETPCAGRVRTA
jgi:hypothetical protein